MTRTQKKRQKIQFQMGWGGLVALTLACVCILLWVFVLGFWVGQKLVGRAEYELHPTASVTDIAPKASPSGLPTENIEDVGTKAESASQKDHAIGNIFALQIASYREKGQAEKEYRKWRDKGYHMQIKKANLGPNKGIWYRVYLGQFHSLKEAIASSDGLARKEGLKSYVVPLGE